MPPQERDHKIVVGDDGDVIRVRFRKDGSRIDRFTVQFETEIDGDLKPVVRYDTAHGFAHQDTLDWDGQTLHWQPMHNRHDFANAMTEAIADLTSNWERYRADFLRRRP